MKVSWAPSARADVKAAADYVAEHDRPAAARLAQRLTGAARTIAAHPGIGRVGRLSETREFFVSGTPYIIVYRLADHRLEIVRVLHTSRLWPENL
ncbi:type II toxin-antitoxin system RelE/ParE family toxin [Enterovirga sp. CN4-39]|uniref:type II toxin-antitoxin system RelE/ParE family toxin n=1 Tax=Enterovirga sp. CN4-39 TaxID=3400910 RepID=UPI003C0E3ADB